jgi:hypothetical protein
LPAAAVALDEADADVVEADEADADVLEVVRVVL